VTSMLRYFTQVGEQCVVISVLSSVSVFVCLCVCLWAYLWNHWTDLREILCADPLWLCLGPRLASLQYIMCFRFCGWHHVIIGHIAIVALRYRSRVWCLWMPCWAVHGRWQCI